MFVLDPSRQVLRSAVQLCPSRQLQYAGSRRLLRGDWLISWHKPGKKSPADGIVVPNLDRKLPPAAVLLLPAVSDAPPRVFPACFFSQAELLCLTSKHCREVLLCMLYHCRSCLTSKHCREVLLCMLYRCRSPSHRELCNRSGLSHADHKLML